VDTYLSIPDPDRLVPRAGDEKLPSGSGGRGRNIVQGDTCHRSSMSLEDSERLPRLSTIKPNEVSRKEESVLRSSPMGSTAKPTHLEIHLPHNEPALPSPARIPIDLHTQRLRRQLHGLPERLRPHELERVKLLLKQLRVGFEEVRGVGRLHDT
jgi:hypothetical protein